MRLKNLSETLEVAVVGIGHFGRRHVQCYRYLRRSRLLALVDPNPATWVIARRLGVSWLPRVDLLPSSVQAVSVATPVASHYQIAQALLQRGMDVLLEKPMAETSAQARELRALAESHGRVLQIGHLERFNPAFAAGRALMARAQRIRAVRTTCRQPRSGAVDVVMDLMIHDLDLLLYGVLSQVVEIRARGRTCGWSAIDEAEVELRFANGCEANLFARWGAETEGARDRHMVLELGNGEVWALDFRRRVVYRQRHDAREPNLPEPAAGDDPLRGQLSSFLESAWHRSPPSVSAQEGLTALDLMQRVRLHILGPRYSVA